MSRHASMPRQVSVCGSVGACELPGCVWAAWVHVGCLGACGLPGWVRVGCLGACGLHAAMHGY